MREEKKSQEDGRKIWQVLHDAGYKDIRIEAYANHFKVDIPRDNKSRWHNEDGTLKCFGKALEYTKDGQSLHCLQLDDNECNEALRKECWKISGVKEPESNEILF